MNNKPAVNHSDLARRMDESLQRVHKEILSYTSGGVAHEGGPLVAVNQAAMAKQNAESIMGATPKQVIRPAYALSGSSLDKLEHVLPSLVKVVKEAILMTSQDFAVACGLRTMTEQKIAMAQGTTRTMHSQHLIQPDGFSHAVDLVPVVNGRLSWDWTRIYPIAFAMDIAAQNQGVANHIRWGGAWDRRLSDFGGSVGAYKDECAKYGIRHTGADFLDGPHFEWIA